MKYPKLLQVDPGREFMGAVTQLLEKHSVRIRRSRTEIHRNQGVVERFNRTFLVLQQQQNLGRRFGTSKMHLSLPVAWAAVRSKAVVLLLLTCLLLLPLWESVIVLCFVVRYFMSILVLQSS